jgi:hypothetical protein
MAAMTASAAGSCFALSMVRYTAGRCTAAWLLDVAAALLLLLLLMLLVGASGCQCCACKQQQQHGSRCIQVANAPEARQNHDWEVQDTLTVRDADIIASSTSAAARVSSCKVNVHATLTLSA